MPRPPKKRAGALAVHRGLASASRNLRGPEKWRASRNSDQATKNDYAEYLANSRRIRKPLQSNGLWIICRHIIRTHRGILGRLLRQSVDGDLIRKRLGPRYNP